MRLAALIVAAAAASAQTPSFVASVKLNPSPEARGLSEFQPGGRFTATAINVMTLIRLAYGVQGYQLAGAPAWFSTKRYDIAAKAEGTPPSRQVFIQTLLKDKFRLAVHNETRELPAFALKLARNDGKPGPQLRKSDFDCAAYNGAPHPPPEPGRVAPCSARINMGALSARSIPVSQLANSLGFFVGRFVVDKTGLTDVYDVDLTWTPDPAVAPDAANNDSAGPSIFTALREQLGLKAVAQKAAVEVLVVDHAEEPAVE